MSDYDISQLNDKYALQGDNSYVRFQTGEGGLPVVEIQNSQASATICLQGAHLLSWIPGDEEEVIWLSEAAKFNPGKAIRGGIPICWPWFGAHGSATEEARPDFPAHGFVRTANWKVICTEALDGDSTRITFTTEPQPENAHMWPAGTNLQLQVTIGKKLEMELITHNNGSEQVTIGQALHTYFRVGDVNNVLVHGLEDTVYLDKLEAFKRKQQIGPITISEEVDRIYLDTTNDCVIEDRSLKRNIIIIKCGSNSTVVWNPWRETASKMGDLGADGYKTMLCVESCNAATDVVTIEPGKAHHLWVQYDVQEIQ
jgi:glucose-6-phosphate 1-epimerase